MENTVASVRINNKLTGPFQISHGLKQGDELVPTLFNLALEPAIRKIDVGRGNLLEEHDKYFRNLKITPTE